MQHYLLKLFAVAFGMLLAVPVGVICSNVPCWFAQASAMHGCPMQHRNVDWLRGAGGYF